MAIHIINKTKRYWNITFCCIGSVLPTTLQAQQKEEELKLNMDAVKMIQFNFNRGTQEVIEQPIDAPLEKKWMKFRSDLSMPRSLTDTTKVKKIEYYVRPEPYTIWVRFGENPVYDVIPSLKKQWKIHWTLNPFKNYQEEYGKSIKPGTGEMYSSINTPAGPSVAVVFDADKLLYESLTKRGRAIRHNRKHANAWKTYKEYQPTAADSAKFPHFIPFLPIYQTQADSLSTPQQAQKNVTPNSQKLRTQPEEGESRFSTYIKQRMAEDSIRRQEFLRKDKIKHNAYETEKQIRRLKEQQD
ncbi:DUF4858 domain-containing protein [Phocaeicola sp. HCN-40430]|uniref:DUF4858 domain-containing protein n=1 Tax=Phocaeicola acetigenes TaxID=3016083 RepID=A0ABT4PDQ5_9BACT|nr:DUF4858 domain-containing protein [Phocaeicola sp. KGMB11183]MCZ8371181.1 DUF4858 domain-containing protein [Phocaeicola sp. KGMB11183]